MHGANFHGPSLAEAMQEALAAYRAGNLRRAEELCRTILHHQGNHFEALSLLGALAAQNGQPTIAVELFHRAVTARPENAIAHVNYGNALQMVQHLEAALDSYELALKLKPDDFEAYVNRGNVQQRLKRFQAALDSYECALKLKPDDSAVHMNRGVALSALNRFEAALDSYERSLQLKPRQVDAYINRGNAERKLKRFAAALDSYERAIKLKPDDAAAYLSRGLVYSDLKRFDAAVASYDCALKLRPDYAEAYNSRGIALHESKHLEAALSSFERALQVKPDYADAYNNRGITLQELKSLDAALASYDQALGFDPSFAEAHLNRGNLLRELRFIEAALDSYESALRIKPDYAEAYTNRGQLLLELNRFDEASKNYERAFEINPELKGLLGCLLHAKMHLCAWRGVDAQVIGLETELQQGRRVTPPFFVIGLVDSLPIQRRAAEIWIGEVFPRCDDLPPIGKRVRHRKIRLGYFSSDFHEHATTHLITELFERHDRDRFDLVAFSLGRDPFDEVTKRVSGAFDQFLEVRSKSDKEVAQISRELEIDIAVDLKGHTRDARTGIFAYRAAPIQVNYLGYPGTMGAPYIDYIVADRRLIPAASRHEYTEKICYLPNSYQVNSRLRQPESRTHTRQEFGLPATGFVFCCFNNAYKITASTFDTWARILKLVEGSVLWLLIDSETAIDNLRREAAMRGLSPARLVFASRMPIESHLARHHAADLFLDTSPYNAHTTASDALWMGLPVITRAGNCFAARVAASLLTAIGMPELITETSEQYETRAVELASTPARLTEIREKLHRNLVTAPLFDTALFTKHLEEAYSQMYQRYQRGLEPEHMFIDP